MGRLAVRTTVDGVTYLHGARPPGARNGPSEPRVMQLLADLTAKARRGEVLSIAVAMVVPHGAQVTAALAWTDLPGHAMALTGANSKLARDITEA